MAVTSTRMDYHAIDAVSFQHRNGQTVDVYAAYCTGQLGVETETREIRKTCRGITTHKRTKPVAMSVKVNIYAPIELVRAWFGLKTEGLKTGVHAYGTDAAGGDFALVTKLTDEFEGKSTMKAFPRITASSGYTVTVDNDADEVAKVEFDGVVTPDEKGNFMYESDSISAADEKKWLEKFEPALVEAPVVP